MIGKPVKEAFAAKLAAVTAGLLNGGAVTHGSTESDASYTAGQVHVVYTRASMTPYDASTHQPMWAFVFTVIVVAAEMSDAEAVSDAIIAGIDQSAVPSADVRVMHAQFERDLGDTFDEGARTHERAFQFRVIATTLS
jgi:hypothetical protein